MTNPLPTASSKYLSLFILSCVCTLLFAVTVSSLEAQEQEAGSTTSSAVSEQSGADIPADPVAEDAETGSKDPKKDERPRELGVMILIVWLLAGAGIGILIFTSLFGHSVRSMIRRPYPNQMHPPRREQPESPGETSTEVETGDEKTQS